MSERRISNFEIFHAATNPLLKREDQGQAGTGLISSHAWQRGISTFLLVGMVVLFGLLLWSKWLGASWLVEANLFPIS